MSALGEMREDIIQGLAYSVTGGREELARFEAEVRAEERVRIAIAIEDHGKAAAEANEDDSEDYVEGIYVAHRDCARIARFG